MEDDLPFLKPIYIKNSFSIETKDSILDSLNELQREKEKFFT